MDNYGKVMLNKGSLQFWIWNTVLLLNNESFYIFSSPGVTITELQKRGGLNEEAYANVSTLLLE